jgi:hypothetical protein
MMICCQVLVSAFHLRHYTEEWDIPGAVVLHDKPPDFFAPTAGAARVDPGLTPG